MHDTSAEAFARRLQTTSQGTLVEFLSISLDTAFVMLKTAGIEGKDDSEYCLSAVTRISEALATIKRLTGCVEEPCASREIHARIKKLQSALVAFRLTPSNLILALAPTL